jgi:putative FmdB family regulatory protein
MAYRNYKCKQCNYTFEKFSKSLKEEDLVKCEKCGGDTIKLISSPLVKIPEMHRAVNSK